MLLSVVVCVASGLLFGLCGLVVWMFGVGAVLYVAVFCVAGCVLVLLWLGV